MQKPTNKSNKPDILAYLEAHQIEHDPELTKKELMALIPADQEETEEEKKAREEKEAAEKLEADEKAAANKNAEKSQKAANLEAHKKSITQAEKTHNENIAREQAARAVLDEANTEYMKARKESERTAALLKVAQVNRVFNEKDLKEMAKDYFNRHPNVHVFYASDDGTFFFKSSDVKGAKGISANVHTFKRS